MFQILLPVTSVLSLVWIGHRSLTILAALLKVTNVDFAVQPDLFAEAFHVCIPELPCVSLLQVCEVVCSFAIKDAVLEVTLVVACICPLVATMAIFLALFKMPYVLRPVRFPGLHSEAILAVVFPLTFELVAL